MIDTLITWLPNMLAGWGVQAIGVFSPGPGVALIMAFATTQGRTPAVVTCLGIALGSAVIALSVILGLGVIVTEIAWAMSAIKFLGAAYLSWLAYKSFGNAFRSSVAGAPPKSATGKSVMAGFTLQATNPKAIFYWLAAIALAGLNAAPWPVIAVFLLGSTSISFFGHATWAVALSSKPFLTLYQRSKRWVDGTLGAFFAFAAFKLATSKA